MNERNLRVLEYPKILELLAALCASESGRALARALVPSSDPAEVRRAQDQTEEAGVVRAYRGGSPMTSFADVGGHLKIAAASGTLSPKALLDVADLLRASRGVRSALITEREDTPLLTDLGARLTTNRNLEEEIFNAILSEDEIADRASPELYDIRRHIRQTGDRMREKLNGMAKNATMAKYLQDTIVTMRGGRYVVPVKAECRQFVPGLVHDQSTSGSTLYIEPMAVVEAGNELKQWAAKEQREIERILAELSGKIAPDAEMLTVNIRVLSELDVIFAKAQLGRDMRAVTPKLNTERRINLIKARHPLIDPEAVVPISLNLGGAFRQLIVTGPNTGGKTVTLKTVGLLTLMAQSGMMVPAAPGSELAIFDDVFADIGDEQSIEQSLSTFSSHMTNIVSILARSTGDSLTLFDELGAGTDPTEGAALAMSILTELLERGVTVMATTHYAELKAFALSTKGVENASVEFDVATLRPTYRLSIGVPGKSNAFEISRRLGLPGRLIEAANERLSTDQIRFEDVIANAEYHRQVAEKERELAEQAHRETQRLRDEAELLQRQLEDQRAELIRKAKEEARRIVRRAQNDSETVVAELKRMRKAAGGVKEHEIALMRAQLDRALGDAQDEIRKATPSGEAPTDVQIGETVELLSLNTRATVLTRPDAKGECTVQAGAMKLKAKTHDMRRVAPEKPKKPSRTHVGVSMKPVSLECDVRGLTLEEALMSVDMFLDGAVMQSLESVQIIHGKGTGVLRGGVQEHLKRHPAVKEYRLGRYGEGEDGVTVVTLK
ncbi:MAG: endonuclease MutS2 [Christensenellaceae bacterium]|nr:endonuclease MutS2 [Christensenellaceae bacterium]